MKRGGLVFPQLRKEKKKKRGAELTDEEIQKGNWTNATKLTEAQKQTQQEMSAMRDRRRDHEKAAAAEAVRKRKAKSNRRTPQRSFGNSTPRFTAAP